MSERWKPGLNEVFWYINSGNKIDYTTNNGFGCDEEKIAAGNCFFTQAEAQAAAEKVKALLLSLHTTQDKALPKLTAEVFERPAKLPDWCKVGEWVFADPEKIFGPAGYKKIKTTDGLGLIFADGCCIYFSDKIKQARLRPYNADEMKALVGRVVNKKDGDVFLVTAYTPVLDSRNLSAVDIDGMWVMPDDVFEYFTIDNKPCGKFEHLENGEWVE